MHYTMITHEVRPGRAATLAVAAGLLMITVTGAALAQCSMRLDDNTYHRPLNYNDPDPGNRGFIRTVEEYHFSPQVESLRRGSTSPLPIDLDYTLRHVPNHYRALASFAKWDLANRLAAQRQPRDAECFFRRAIGLRPTTRS